MMLLHKGGFRLVGTANFAGNTGVAVSQTMVNGERKVSLIDTPGAKPAGIWFIEPQTLSRLNLHYGTPAESQATGSFRAGAGGMVVSGEFYAQVDQLEDGIYRFGDKLTTGNGGKLKVKTDAGEVEVGEIVSQPTIFPGGRPVDVLFKI